MFAFAATSCNFRRTPHSPGRASGPHRAALLGSCRKTADALPNRNDRSGVIGPGMRTRSDYPITAELQGCGAMMALGNRPERPVCLSAPKKVPHVRQCFYL